MHNPEERRHRPLEEDFRVPPSKYTVQAPDTAARRGVITHRVLQHLNFATASNVAGVESELRRMVGEGLLHPEETALVNEASIAWFLSTPLAAAIRDAGETYRREFLYIATQPLEYFDRTVGTASREDQVLVRGMVDGILPVKDGIEIIDFKTDAISPEEVSTRAERYRAQMEIYAKTMSKIWRRPVLTCWLVFLAAEALVGWNDLGLGRSG
jgi:ATP-dependent helicase/nuclease subunit A